ncbi:hypothetical protein X737_27700 [Mesorhizobium sp. L48C026A00]|nr:hypothetical protein X737_27700 [Mesorhizobium sp. L48C026A00]
MFTTKPVLLRLANTAIVRPTMMIMTENVRMSAGR